MEELFPVILTAPGGYCDIHDHTYIELPDDEDELPLPSDEKEPGNGGPRETMTYQMEATSS